MDRRLTRSVAALCVVIFMLATTCTAVSAHVYEYNNAQATTTVRTPTVQLQSGTVGSSTVSNSVYATVTVASPAQSLYYVPVTFTNNQGSSTPNPLQVSIQANPSLYSTHEASDLGNIRFCSDTGCNTELYSWLEGCGSSAPYGACSTASTSATFWVKLTSSIAGSGGTLTVYMAFLSTSINFDGVQAGEAPTLSATYAQFDNGAKVFLFYDNFAGTTISSAWNVVGASGTYSVDNGLVVDSLPFPGYSFSLNNEYTGPLIVDAYQVGTTGAWLGASFSNLVTTSSSYTVTSGAAQWVYPPEGSDGINGLCIASGCTGFTPNPVSTTLQVVTLAVSSTAAVEYQDYANPVTATGTNSLTNYPGVVQVGYASSDTQTTYWFRLRAYPPGNVMPSASFGSLTLGAILSLPNSGSSSWLVNLAVVSSTNTARLNNLTLSFRNPYSKQVVLGSGVPNQNSGPQVTLAASTTMLIAIGVTVSSAGTTTVTLALKIQSPPSAGAASVYCYDVIALTVN
jgi:hypothetical protein